MRSSLRSLGLSALGAGALGALSGALSAAEVLARGRLYITDPWPLLGLGAVYGALVAAPGLLALALAGEARRSTPGAVGVVGAAGLIGLLELALLVMEDPPPFQEAPWYVGSPVAGLLGALVLLGLTLGLARLGRLGAYIAGSALLSAQLSATPPAPPPPPPPGSGPNLLLVTLDTTRADHLSAYGGRAKTPNLERLAARGLRFDAAFAPIAVTGPSHTSILSGQGTWSHGVLLNGVPAPETPLLAERAQLAGYETAAFVSAYVLDRRIGLERGFGIYDDDFSERRGSSALLAARLRAALLRHAAPDEVLERRGDRTVDLAEDWLAQAPADRPWLLWVHLFDAHGPYAPPPPYDTMYYTGDPRDPANTSMQAVHDVAPYLEESLAGITDVEQVIAWYDGELSFADAQLGRLLDAVEARGEQTVVAVLGDHGESLGEHGVWFDHGDDVYDPSLHVPLVLSAPGVLPEGEVREELVELVDVLPTLAALLSLDGFGELDGRALLRPADGGVARSMVFDREANLAGRAAGELQRPTWRMVGLRSAESLYVRREAEGYPDALYMAEEGTGYRKMSEVDVMSEFVGEPGWGLVLGALREMADGLLEAGQGGVERSGVELSEEERARLEALGYLE
ncbi:MAG: sulfatase [Alphaproteobacteria bacterium]|nr:sulfatase [Alphaproteobacteria bacterium]MCB9795969.1 sulfatase [Alphaproteobacteria bacterium]